MSLQPRFGLSYLGIDCKELKLELELGTYVEFTRIDNIAPRWHGTIGIELKPWVLNLGWGLDQARDYQNFIVTFGVDVGAVLRKLDIFPQERQFPRGGLLPNPFRISEVGLSHSLVPGSEEIFGKPAIQVGLEAPERLRNLFMNGPKNLAETLKQVGSDIPGTLHEAVDLWPAHRWGSPTGPTPESATAPVPPPKPIPSER